MYIILQGDLEYNGMNISYIVSETDSKKLEISLSFIKGSKENKVNFEFNQKEENYYTLDRKKTESEIDLNILNNIQEGKIEFGTSNLENIGSIKMILKKKKENELKDANKSELLIERKGKIIENLTENNCAKIFNNNLNLNINLDTLIDTLKTSNGFVKKYFTLPVIKSLCNDFIKVINSKIYKNNNKKSFVKVKKTSKLLIK